jgi:hypothetical protein
VIPRVGYILAVSLLAAALSACGGGNGAGDRGGAAKRRAAVERSPEAVIRAWVDTLRRGDVAKAATYFGLPAIAQNGTPPIELTTREQVRAFNASLPCGARLLSTSTSGRYTTAVFRLTERPGPGRCGQGTGQTARTKFLIRDGRIREWRRLANEPSPSAPVV